MGVFRTIKRIFLHSSFLSHSKVLYLVRFLYYLLLILHVSIELNLVPSCTHRTLVITPGFDLLWLVRLYIPGHTLHVRQILVRFLRSSLLNPLILSTLVLQLLVLAYTLKRHLLVLPLVHLELLIQILCFPLRLFGSHKWLYRTYRFLSRILNQRIPFTSNC